MAGVVTGIREKPVASVDVNLGMYALSRREVLPLLNGVSGRIDMPDLVPLLLAAGKSVAAARFDCQWFDIGEERDLYAARDAFGAGADLFLGRLRANGLA